MKTTGSSARRAQADVLHHTPPTSISNRLRWYFIADSRCREGFAALVEKGISRKAAKDEAFTPWRLGGFARAIQIIDWTSAPTSRRSSTTPDTSTSPPPAGP